jgi:hypothetical protein
VSVLRTDSVKAIDFRMRASAYLMISLTDDPIPMNQDGAHHRIGGGMTQSVTGKFQTAEHVSFIGIHLHLRAQR